MGIPRSRRARPFRARLARLHDEGGFTLVEAMAAISILAVGSFAAAQALTFGLGTSGMSRERLAARSATDQQMEFARSLNYDSLVLDDATDLAHSTDTSNPDYWINEGNQTFDPDGSGPMSPEPLIRVAGASPALHHFQNPVVQGDTVFSVYMYVTWVDSPVDGLGALDKADGNANGVSDAFGEDQKRVTVIVTWSDPLHGGLTSVTQQSLFSDQQIPFHQPAKNNPPSVSCPTVSDMSGKTVTFTAQASDSDGTIASVSWNFGDSSPPGSGMTATHTYSAYGVYTIINSVVDNGGATATNTALSCQVNVQDPDSGNGGPTGSIKILNDATYTNVTSITLNLKCPLTGSTTCTQMQFSNDDFTWSSKQAYGTSTIWTLSSGDGVKTVYVRYWSSATLYGPVASDQITLDQTPPPAPTGLKFTSKVQGGNKTINLSWTAPSPFPSDFSGYRVWKRLTTGSTWSQVSCSSGTTCSTTVKKTDNYEFYVEAYDLAGNTSAQSNHVTA